MARKNTAASGLHITVKKIKKGAPAAGASRRGPKYREAVITGAIDNEKIAHDLRASLNIIIGFTQLLLEEVLGKINEEQRRSLNDVLAHGRRLFDLSDDIIKKLEIVERHQK